MEDRHSLNLEFRDKEHQYELKHFHTNSLNPALLQGMLSLGETNVPLEQGVKSNSLETLIPTYKALLASEAAESNEIVCSSPYCCSPSVSPRAPSSCKSEDLLIKCQSPYSLDVYEIATLKQPISQFQPQFSVDTQSSYYLKEAMYFKNESTMNICESSAHQTTSICIVPLSGIINASQNKRLGVTVAHGAINYNTYDLLSNQLDEINQKQKVAHCQKYELKNDQQCDGANAKKGQANVESSVTLFEEPSSAEDILRENGKLFRDTSFQDSLIASLEWDGKKNSSRTNRIKLSRKIFRILNFLRALAIAIYALVISSRQLQNPDILALGAKNLLITSIVFACLDVIVAFIRLFPQYFWCFWDIKNWDPYSKTYSVWALIANHDLLIDIIPVLLNVIVRIYLYRMAEILANPSLKDNLYNLSIVIVDITDIFKYQNFIILMCFVASLIYTITFHASSLLIYLLWDRSSGMLGVMVFFKSLLLIFDLLSNGMLFYKVLVYKGIDLFDLNGLIAFTISVAAPSPFITLITNGLVNVPLHFYNFKMRLHARPISNIRILRAAGNQAFHTVLIPFFLYLFYSCGALIYILKEIRVINSAVEDLLPQSSFFGWTSGQDILLGMIWTNVVLNYLGGMIFWILFSLFKITTCHDTGGSA